uniref:Ras-associating domain-containing protein n=1 Tax=Ornithorhynchus anatinus TaxID=9258 RepID=A0A6I8PQM3_ORNAN
MGSNPHSTTCRLGELWAGHFSGPQCPHPSNGDEDREPHGGRPDDPGSAPALRTVLGTEEALHRYQHDEEEEEEKEEEEEEEEKEEEEEEGGGGGGGRRREKEGEGGGGGRRRREEEEEGGGGGRERRGGGGRRRKRKRRRRRRRKRRGGGGRRRREKEEEEEKEKEEEEGEGGGGAAPPPAPARAPPRPHLGLPGGGRGLGGGGQWQVWGAGPRRRRRPMGARGGRGGARGGRRPAASAAARRRRRRRSRGSRPGTPRPHARKTDSWLPPPPPPAMELKVWVDGVQRVVCGVSDKTSCQEVVIALARAIGQTGRYVLIQRLREKERQLLPHECPVATQAQCGQSAHDVQFVLRRTGPSLAERPASDGCPPPPPPERNFARASLPAKARPAPGKAPTLGPGAERLREPGVRPDAPSPAPAPGREPPEAAELLRLERLVRRNEAELGEEAFWQGELRQERARQRQGQETVRGLRAATRDYVRQLRDLAARARALEEELRRARAPRPPAPRPRPPAPAPAPGGPARAQPRSAGGRGLQDAEGPGGQGPAELAAAEQPGRRGPGAGGRREEPAGPDAGAGRPEQGAAPVQPAAVHPADGRHGHPPGLPPARTRPLPPRQLRSAPSPVAGGPRGARGPREGAGGLVRAGGGGRSAPRPVDPGGASPSSPPRTPGPPPRRARAGQTPDPAGPAAGGLGRGGHLCVRPPPGPRPSVRPPSRPSACSSVPSVRLFVRPVRPPVRPSRPSARSVRPSVPSVRPPVLSGLPVLQVCPSARLPRHRPVCLPARPARPSRPSTPLSWLRPLRPSRPSFASLPVRPVRPPARPVFRPCPPVLPVRPPVLVLRPDCPPSRPSIPSARPSAPSACPPVLSGKREAEGRAERLAGIWWGPGQGAVPVPIPSLPGVTAPPERACTVPPGTPAGHDRTAGAGGGGGRRGYLLSASRVREGSGRFSTRRVQSTVVNIGRGYTGGN